MKAEHPYRCICIKCRLDRIGRDSNIHLNELRKTAPMKKAAWTDARPFQWYEQKAKDLSAKQKGGGDV